MSDAPWRRQLDLLPFQEWLPAADVAARTGIAPEDTSTVLRCARRRGSLRTRGQGAEVQVMRVRRVA
ncbi:hypothetical protein [Streptomyces sp. NPDC088915]|uniref:hypothetical protein n=1 Tax=Streptomyces sp. NPDC088915 TaxID=3365912 RepID=UPI0037FCB21C